MVATWSVPARNSHPDASLPVRVLISSRSSASDDENIADRVCPINRDPRHSQQIRGEHERPQRVVGRSGARVAHDLGIPDRQTEDGERVEAGVHAREHGEPASGPSLDGRVVSGGGSIALVRGEEVIERMVGGAGGLLVGHGRGSTRAGWARHTGET